jgi:hypothetical protein
MIASPEFESLSLSSIDVHGDDSELLDAALSARDYRVEHDHIKIYIYMYVCMHACTYVCTHVHVHVHVHVCMYVCSVHAFIANSLHPSNRSSTSELAELELEASYLTSWISSSASASQRRNAMWHNGWTTKK